MTREIKLLPKTDKARLKLNQIFMAHQGWKGKWFVLDTEDKGQRLLVAPVGHPWDKVGRWIHSTKDQNFIVKELV